MKYTLLLIFLGFFTLHASAQKSKQCNCSSFPIKPNTEECVLFCLKYAKAAELEKSLNIDGNTANEISNVKDRTSIKSIEGFKSRLSTGSYKKLEQATIIYIHNETSYDNSQKVDQGVIVNGQTYGPVAGRDVNTYVIQKPEDANNYTPSEFRETFNGLEITITHCVVRNYRLVVNGTLRNVSENPTYKINFQKGENRLTDDQGNVYYTSALKIGNVQNEKYGYARYQLVKGVVVNIILEYAVGRNDIQKIAQLEMGATFHNVPVNNK